MELYPLDIAIHIINIAVLFLLLRFLVYKPVRKFMQQRDEKIAMQLNDAQTAKQESDTLRQQCAAQLASAEEQASKMVRDGAEQATREANSILADAKGQADALKEEARQNIEVERHQVMESMQGEISAMAVEMAGRILRREVRLEDNQAVANDFWEKAEEYHEGSDIESRPAL